jgi:hypothetical protein
MATLKNTRPDGTAAVPSAYKLEEVTITNKIGEAVDIWGVVKDVSFIESIYSPSIVCTVTVKDESNLIESLPMYGLETIKIKISRKQGEEGVVQTLERLFYVTDYPLFGRPRQEHMQVWTITGTSFHAWKNPLIKISRWYEGPIVDQIVKIGEDAFGLKVLVEGDADPDGKGIINIQTPLHAIDWFRRKLHEAGGEPFYFYETCQSNPNEINLRSHTILTNQAPHNQYYDARTFNELSGTQKDYDQRKQRIVDVSSELKFSKFNQIYKGTFGAENTFVDIATRKFSKMFYGYTADFPIDKTINKTNILEPPPTFEFPEGQRGGGAPTVTENKEAIEEEFFSFQEHLSRNSEAFFDTPLQNYTEWYYEKSKILTAFPGVFNTLAHDVTVFGDFELNAGKMVELFFPKAADPGTTGKDNLWDENLSGKYLVMSTIHRFKDQEYYTEFRAKRDSFSD